MFVLVVHNIYVLTDYPLLNDLNEYFFSHLIICTIGGHPHHAIVFLSHREVTKRHIIKPYTKCIHVYNIIVSEVIIGLLAIDVECTVTPLHDDNGFIYSLLLYIHQYLKNIETRI